MAANYVKFVRGTAKAFKNAVKNKDTLYFITDAESGKSTLYLGDKTISDDLISFTDLDDILFSNLNDNDLLIYNAEKEKWINKSIFEAIPQMQGSKNGNQGSPGLVPPPGINAENFFLRGDGVWAPIVEDEPGSKVVVDNATIESKDDNITITLKNYGKKYYKFVGPTGSIEDGTYVDAYYTPVLVDASHPWLEGLEPRVVNENHSLVLGWFEPEGNLNKPFIELSEKVETLDKKLLEKVDSDKVYTREEIEEKIHEAVNKVNKLSRKIFNSIEEAYNFALSQEDPKSFIYMILNEESSEQQYNEYFWEDGELVFVGSWNTELGDYATVKDLENKVDKKDGYSLIEQSALEKLSAIEDGAEKNIIGAVNSEEFELDEHRTLKISALPITKITNLADILAQHSQSIQSVQTNSGELITKITSLETLLKEKYVHKDVYGADMNLVKDSIIWKKV